MRWLGFDWDEGPEVGGPHGPYLPVRAVRRLRRRRRPAARGRPRLRLLLLRPRSSSAPQRRPRSEGRAPGYDGHCRDLTDEQAPRSWPRAARRCCGSGCPTAPLTFDDLVRGEITFQPENVPDYVLVRANGHPLYTLVNPVDDALMEITHVLRGEDLLSSTPR